MRVPDSRSPAVLRPAIEDDDVQMVARCQRLTADIEAYTTHPPRSSMGHEYFEFCKYMAENASLSHSQIFQDLWILFELQEKRGGYFIEFGACDGVFLSNTILLEKVYGWSGIVGDPNPKYRKALRKNRECKVTSRCIYPGPRRRRTFRCTADGAFSTLEEFAQLDSHWEEYRTAGYEHASVYTVSINDILKEANAPPVIDYMSLDTEGSELDILHDFDFSRRTVRAITVEHNFTPRREEIHDFLERKGYVRKLSSISRWDDWYVLQ